MSLRDSPTVSSWLRARGASQALLAAVEGGGSATSLCEADRELWVEARLVAATSGAVDLLAVDAVEALARQLRFGPDDWEDMVRSWLGITGTRLRAYGTLRLPVHASVDEVRAAHRTIAREVHPDRLAGADRVTRDRATRWLGHANHARAVLLSAKDGIVTQGEDDVLLPPPSFEPDDAPTEVDLEHHLVRGDG